MRTRPDLIACALTALFMQGCAGLENYVDTTDAFVEGDTLYLSGTMNARTVDELESLLSEHHDLRRVEIGMIDGSVDDDMNLQAGLLIHEAGLDTHLLAESLIESGGVDIFCAGHKRTAERGAHVGVHAWAYADDSKSGFDLSEDDPDHQIYIDYFEIVGCPVDFYWYTLEAAPADDIHIMSDSELIEQGVVTAFTD